MTTRSILTSADAAHQYESNELSNEQLLSIRSKMKTNYFGIGFGLTDQIAPAALTYQSRKPLETSSRNRTHDDDMINGKPAVESMDIDARLKSLIDDVDDAVDNSMSSGAAQRKVAEALLKMVENEAMIYHFLYHGGLDAVLKLINESKDSKVLVTCTRALFEASMNPKNCKGLIDRGILQILQ